MEIWLASASHERKEVEGEQCLSTSLCQMLLCISELGESAGLPALGPSLLWCPAVSSSLTSSPSFFTALSSCL